MGRDRQPLLSVQTRWLTPEDLKQLDEMVDRREALYDMPWDPEPLKLLIVQLKRFCMERHVP